MSDDNCCGNCENCEGSTVREEIRLDHDVYIGLIELFVRQNLLPESNDVFNEYRSTISIEKALTNAIINDMANTALTVVVDELTTAEDLIAKGEAIKARYTFYNKNNKEDNTDDNSTEEEIPR